MNKEEWHSEKINVTSLFICGGHGEEILMTVSWRKCVDCRDLYIQTVDMKFLIQKNYRAILDRMYGWKEGVWNTRSTIRFPTGSTIRSRSIEIDCFSYT